MAEVKCVDKISPSSARCFRCPLGRVFLPLVSQNVAQLELWGLLPRVWYLGALTQLQMQKSRLGSSENWASRVWRVTFGSNLVLRSLLGAAIALFPLDSISADPHAMRSPEVEWARGPVLGL